MKGAALQVAVFAGLNVAPKGTSSHMGRGRLKARQPPTPQLNDLLGELEFGIVDTVLDEDGEIGGHLTKELAEETEWVFLFQETS